MQRVSRATRGFFLVFATLWLLCGSALAATISGTVFNDSTATTGNIYLEVKSTDGWETNVGTVIASPGAFTLRGVPDWGQFVVRAYRDVNGDGMSAASEPVGVSSSFSVQDGTVTGSANVTLKNASYYGDPTAISLSAVDAMSVLPGDGMIAAWFDLYDNNVRDQYGRIGADSVTVEWSTNNFTTIAGSKTYTNLSDESCMIRGLTNGTTYQVRMKTVAGASTATSDVFPVVVGPPAGGYSISGTVTLNGISVPVNTPVYVIMENLTGTPYLYKSYPSVSNGMAYTLTGATNGTYDFYAVIDTNKDGTFNIQGGDYFVYYGQLTVNGANVTGLNLSIGTPPVFDGNLEVSHTISPDGLDHWYNIGVDLWGESKLFKKAVISGPGLLETDVAIRGGAVWFNFQPSVDPEIGTIYNVAANFTDNTTATIPMEVTTLYDSPVPQNISPSGAITTSPTDISWEVPGGTLPAGWNIHVNMWGDGVPFNWRVEDLPGDTTSVLYDGPELTSGAYSFQVQFCDPNWNCIGKQANFGYAVEPPAGISVPTSDDDGNYTVNWGASSSPNVRYVIEQSTDPTFTTNVVPNQTDWTNMPVYNVGGAIYYYRVRAQSFNGGIPSPWVTAANGCKVVNLSPPGSLTIPSTSTTGNYTVSWEPSMSPGVTYVLTEASDWNMTQNLRTAYSGTALSFNVTGKGSGNYYYRVKATKTGYTDGETWSSGGCVVTLPIPDLAAPTLTVPASDADGDYAISWTATSAYGTVYQVEESTSADFSTTATWTFESASALSSSLLDRTPGVTYYYRIRLYYGAADVAGPWSTTQSCYIIPPPTAGLPGVLVVPITDPDRTYKVNWGASATAGVTYVLQESTSSDFSTDLLTLYTGLNRSYIVTNRNFATRYYYRVKATKANYTDSAWRVAANSCDLPVAPPGLVTAPNADADGNYSVSWVASATPGVTYTVSEASDSAFTVGLRKVYEGPDLNVNVTGRAQGKTYYYRVRANLTGLPSSAWRIRLKGCAVPGSMMVTAPGVPVVPATDSDGNFTISWTPSATADVTYELQQATNSAFSTGAFIAYRGTATTVDLTGRAAGKTFYYRVRAIKAGLEDSNFKAATNGCLVGP